MWNFLPPLFLSVDLFNSKSVFCLSLILPSYPAIIPPSRDALDNKAVRSQSRLINQLFLLHSQWGTAFRSISLDELQEVFGWRFVYQILLWEMGLQCSTRHAKYPSVHIDSIMITCTRICTHRGVCSTQYFTPRTQAHASFYTLDHWCMNTCAGCENFTNFRHKTKQQEIF